MSVHQIRRTTRGKNRPRLFKNKKFGNIGTARVLLRTLKMSGKTLLMIEVQQKAREKKKLEKKTREEKNIENKKSKKTKARKKKSENGLY